MIWTSCHEPDLQELEQLVAELCTQLLALIGDNKLLSATKAANRTVKDGLGYGPGFIGWSDHQLHILREGLDMDRVYLEMQNRGLLYLEQQGCTTLSSSHPATQQCSLHLGVQDLELLDVDWVPVFEFDVMKKGPCSAEVLLH